MAYNVQFLTDNLIFQTVKGEYSATELGQAAQEMADMIDKANQPCYLLVDLSKMRTIDNNLSKVKNAVQPLLSHPDLKLLVAYGNSDNTIVNFMSSFMANLFKIPLKILRSQEEAVNYLISQDAALNGKLQAALQSLKEQAV